MEQDREYYESIPAPETATDILFSFEGRLNRARYWGYTILLSMALVLIALWGLFEAGDVGFWSSYAIAVLFVIWPAMALGVKRCHDRDRSGWFMLVSLIPIVSIWYLVEIGFLKGTDGPNRYGEDPLE